MRAHSEFARQREMPHVPHKQIVYAALACGGKQTAHFGKFGIEYHRRQRRADKAAVRAVYRLALRDRAERQKAKVKVFPRGGGELIRPMHIRRAATHRLALRLFGGIFRLAVLSFGDRHRRQCAFPAHLTGGSRRRAFFVRLCARAQHIVTHPAAEIRVGKARARENARKIVCFLSRSRASLVKQTAVYRRHRADILRTLHSALDLQRADARVDKLGDMPGKAVVLQRERVF